MTADFIKLFSKSSEYVTHPLLRRLSDEVKIVTK